MKFQIPIENIRRIVNFYLEVEEKHYNECLLNDCKQANDHIFLDIIMVRNWLFIFEKMDK